MNQVLAAMVAHDIRSLPLTADARYTENGQTLSFGDGLWGTLTGFAGAAAGTGAVKPGSFRADLGDAERSETAFFGATLETSTQGVLALRVRTRGDRIAEIEAIAVRVEKPGERGGTVTLFQPPLLAQMVDGAFDDADAGFVASVPQAELAGRATLTRIVDCYFTGLQAGSSGGIPFADDCRRRENGVRVTGDAEAEPLDPSAPAFRPYALGCAAQIDSGFFSHFARVRGPRHLAVDTARGLVLSVALLDQPGDVEAIGVSGVGRVRFPAGATAEELATTEGTPQFYVKRHEPNFRVPLTQLTAQLTRIERGKIARIEAISRPAPYGVNSGWQT